MSKRKPKNETAEQKAARERDELLDSLTKGLPAAQRRMVRGLASARPDAETVLYALQAHALTDLNAYKSMMQSERNRWSKDQKTARRLRAEAKRVEQESPERADACRSEARSLERRPPQEDRFHVVVTGMLESARKVTATLHEINPSAHNKVLTEMVGSDPESAPPTYTGQTMQTQYDAEFEEDSDK